MAVGDAQDVVARSVVSAVRIAVVATVAFFAGLGGALMGAAVASSYHGLSVVAGFVIAGGLVGSVGLTVLARQRRG